MLGSEPATTFRPNISHQAGRRDSVRLTTYRTACEVPMEEARALLMEHLTWGRARFLDLGAPDFDIMPHAHRFFGHLDEVLPPKGAYVLAHDAAGRAVGTAALRRVSETTGEMKHLYVRPEMRQGGLGTALIAARIDAARRLGVKVLVTDTFRGNAPMIRLYHRMGFAESAPFDSAVAKTSPDLIPHLHFLRRAL